MTARLTAARLCPAIRPRHYGEAATLRNLALSLALIHRSALKVDSANFAYTEFYEVQVCSELPEKSMRAGLSLERRAPPCWSPGDLGGPYSQARPTQSYPLVVVVPAITFVVVPVIAAVVVPVLAFVVVAVRGADRGLSYEQATREQVSVQRLVQRSGRLGGQLGVDAP